MPTQLYCHTPTPFAESIPVLLFKHTRICLLVSYLLVYARSLCRCTSPESTPLALPLPMIAPLYHHSQPFCWKHASFREIWFSRLHSQSRPHPQGRPNRCVNDTHPSIPCANYTAVPYWYRLHVLFSRIVSGLFASQSPCYLRLLFPHYFRVLSPHSLRLQFRLLFP